MTAEERIKNYFNDHYLIQKPYAEKAKIALNRFNRILNGHTKITAEEAKRLAESLNMTVDDLLSYGDSNESET